MALYLQKKLYAAIDIQAYCYMTPTPTVAIPSAYAHGGIKEVF